MRFQTKNGEEIRKQQQRKKTTKDKEKRKTKKVKNRIYRNAKEEIEVRGEI